MTDITTKRGIQLCDEVERLQKEREIFKGFDSIEYLMCCEKEIQRLRKVEAELSRELERKNDAIRYLNNESNWLRGVFK